MDDIERWKRKLLTLPDSSFFDIMRNWLGELRTPFNKHSLIDELVSFLHRPATRERILLSMDENDVRLISALFLLGEPTIDRLYSFFEGELSYLDLHSELLNLEERLLIYRELDHSVSRVYVTPLFRELLLTSVVRPDSLFPSRPVTPGEGPTPWLTDSLALALFSYAVHNENLLKSGGGLKKRAADELANLLPEGKARTERGSRTEIALGALARLGLLRSTEGGMGFDLNRWERFGRLDRESRSLLLWAAALGSGKGPATGTPLPLEPPRVEGMAALLAAFLASLDPGRGYPAVSLERIMQAVEEPNGPRGLPLTSLVELGLLLPAGKGAFRPNLRALELIEPGAAAGDESAPEGGIIVQPNFSITVEPGTGIREGLAVALFAEIRRHDVVSLYEITKRSFLRGLDLGRDAAFARTELEEAGGAPLPQNVAFSLESWEKEYRSVGLFSGIVLTTDEQRRHLVEHSELLRPWIHRILAPGVFLLDPGERDEWGKALERAGIAPVPEIRTAGKPEVLDNGGERLSPVVPGRRLPLSLSTKHAKAEKSHAPLAHELLHLLEERPFSKEQKIELAARIRKKLILFPEQLSSFSGRQERIEATGLDYVGKVRLIEQALSTGSDLLEIIERSAKGATRRLLVRPGEVRRSGNDLLLHGKSLPGDKPVEIKIRKIGLLRKLRGSLFSP